MLYLIHLLPGFINPLTTNEHSPNTETSPWFTEQINWLVSVSWKHNISLGTGPPSKPQPSIFFCLPQALKNLSPPRQTKSPNNSNMLHMFNNNIYTVPEQHVNTS